jgi:hypothetical protein
VTKSKFENSCDGTRFKGGDLILGHYGDAIYLVTDKLNEAICVHVVNKDSSHYIGQIVRITNSECKSTKLDPGQCVHLIQE